tara:strand:- start:2384 stop:3166 length:783 start_codon:yes stop_codon:yes gene_type:complete
MKEDQLKSNSDKLEQENNHNQTQKNGDEIFESSEKSEEVQVDLSSDNTESGNEDSEWTDKTTINETKDPISSTDARLEQLEKEHETLKKEHETLKSQYVRIAADFDNFRKRQSRDQDDLKIQLICNALTDILPIVDNFERARQQLKPEGEEAQNLHRSYQNLYKQLVEVLKQQGVAPMRVLEQPFDPTLHEAVMREPSNEQKEDYIIEELQRGYHLNGKVLRHALVKVSMGPGPENPQDSQEEDTVNEIDHSNEGQDDAQ